MGDLQLRDETTVHDRGGMTRKLVYDVPAPWLLHGLCRTGAYVSHHRGRATIDVALEHDGGYASGLLVPTDGVPAGERSFEEYFSGGPTRPFDKAAITFRPDIHDVDDVVPAVDRAAEWAAEIRGERQ
ncbi:hypothetical protein NP511_22110 (plasmid) [Natrinema thermotolerans]|uniref:Uncharacterized protein n=1 Tax=Natrinema thermotolerans TaxID=121872 RepID=A0AAF0T4C2_9EURY|nr:hypothetical protein [Natrinema thermotolerans]QCC57135.1 hypothetical protein DVR14_00220 [Natrinema thermotolerans]WMT10292.1 hypothetical protein NP511_22110 [Natrinema thermotolerans]